jgi:uncharacterized protein (TIGR03083 family)
VADIGALYREARERITTFVSTLDDTQLAQQVPGCPQWTVHDVVAHLVGITDDALAGNMEGVTTDPWTAAQVERSRDVPTGELVARWTKNAEVFEQFLTESSARAVVDITTHEQDIYGTFGVVAARDTPSITYAMAYSEAPDFEHYRGKLGRRSRAQLDALGIAETTFGPSEVDIIE